MLKFQITV